jgi:RimJ/RimL family protein N-acetyltransferase
MDAPALADKRTVTLLDGRAPERAMRIETERLVLRKPRPEDLDAYARIVSDEETMRFVGGVRDRARARESIETWLRRWDEEGFSHFIVTSRQDSTLVGQVGLTIWDGRTWAPSSGAEAGEHAHVEMGWMLDRAHWGKGYAIEAARAARDWAYSIGIESIVSMILPDNGRSARVAEKLGARPAKTIMTVDGATVLWVHPRSANV